MKPSLTLRQPRLHAAAFGLFAAAVMTAALAVHQVEAQDKLPPAVAKAEADRVAVIEKIKPAVVAVFAAGGKGGGSGVLISPDGYALTNFHVVAGPGPVMQCGLPDGVLYDAVLVGLDKVGDVALIKLLPKPGKEKQPFPYVALGDSDKVKEGDWSLAMGNPFLLATDFTPTVTYGLISGVHRYQYPEGVMLEYTDCIQIDTSINPGNSGGPLFNMQGELIGINGRGSFDKRPRINSGVGYAISINQIKNFMGHLKAGLDTDHATLGAAVTTQTDKTGIGRMEVTQILDTADVYRRGLNYGDEIVSFDGRPIFSTNHFKNVLGLFPKGWRVPLEYRRTKLLDDEDLPRKEILVRLMGVQRKVIIEDDGKGPKQPPPPKMPPGNSPAAKYYVPKEGFANYYFNKQMSDALLKHLRDRGDFTKLSGKWTLDGTIKFSKNNTSSNVRLEVADEKAKEGAGTTPVARMKLGNFPLPTEMFPQRSTNKPEEYLEPRGSGGLLAAIYLYRNLLLKGDKAFEAGFAHGGVEPIYPPSADKKKSFKDRKVMTEVLNAKSGVFTAKFYFSLGEGKDAGRLELMEVRISDTDDPCEVYFSDYREVDGRQVPHTLTVIYGDSVFGTIELDPQAIKLSPPE
jgi:S1-C subfamily serine protease